MKKHLLFLLFIIFSECTESNLAFHPGTNTSDGILKLVKNFGGSKNDVAKSVVSTLDGGFAVLGYTQSIDGDVTDKATEDYDFWMLKIFN